MTLPQLESKLARGGGKSLTKKHTVGNWEVRKQNLALTVLYVPPTVLYIP